MKQGALRVGLLGAVGAVGAAAIAVVPNGEWGDPALSGSDSAQIPARVGPRRLLVFLHGYGGTADDFSELARTLSADVPGDELLLLDGPEPVPDGTGRRWWDVRQGSEEARATALWKAGDALRSRLEGPLHDRGLSIEDVVLIGFSQGAALAMSVGARWRFGGVVAYAGRPVDLPDAPVSTPFLLVVGGRDPLVSASEVEAFATRLRSRGALVQLQVHPNLGHGLDGRAVAETLAFVRTCNPERP